MSTHSPAGKTAEKQQEKRLESRARSPAATTTSVQENPLAQYSHAELEGLAAKFVQEHGLEDIGSDIRKGALLAQNPSGYEGYHLTEDEMAAVTDEINHSASR
jgi:hypothetical protein